MEEKKILLIEDETKIAEVLQAYLEKDGYQVFYGKDGEEGVRLFYQINPILIILDRMLPLRSGESVCKEIRKSSRVPIIMLTAKISETEIVEGFSLGADDYLTKPFRMGELMARIHAVLRRTQEVSQPLFLSNSWNQGDLEIYVKEQTVYKQKQLVSLTPNEWKLLLLFISHPKQIFSREQIIQAAFGMDYDGFDRTIDTHIKNLRSKLEDDSANPRYILTVRGMGYKFVGERSQNHEAN